MSAMTVECHICHHVFGAWRPRCEACGTLTDPRKQREVLTPREEAVTKALRAPRKARPPKAPRKVAIVCALCQHRHPKETCSKCGEPVHRNCRGLHEVRCDGGAS